MRVAITGSHGFIGRHVAAHFRQEGHHITGLDLHPTEVPYFDRVIRGSILSERHLEEALEGVDTVIHTAAIVEEGGDVERFNKLNVDGARLVAEVAKTKGARRLLHLSSVMVYGFNFPDQVSETQPLWPNGNPYCDSKIASEAILKPLADNSFRIIIVRPGDVIGVGSIPWVTRPLDLMRRRLFALPNGGRGRFNPIHVRDVARGLHHLSQLISPHQTYNLVSGISVSCAEYFGNLARACGLRPPLKVPAALLRSTASLMTKSADLLGFRAPFRADGVDFLLRTGTYNGGRLRDSGFFCVDTLKTFFDEVENLSR